MIKNYRQYLKESIDDEELYEEEEDPDEFITDDQFRKFLIDNNCLWEYAENCHARAINNPHQQKNMDNFTKVYNRDYVNSLLAWNDTPEGTNYWQNMSQRWMGIVNEERLAKDKIRLIELVMKEFPEEDIEKLKKMDYYAVQNLRYVLQDKKRKEINKAKLIEKKNKLAAIKKGTEKDFITDDKFRQFLIDNKCYDLYIRNCYNRGEYGFVIKFDKIQPLRWISGAFNWGVKEDYWREINTEWYKILGYDKYGHKIK